MPRNAEMGAALQYDPELGPGYFVQTRSDFLRHGGYSPTAKVLYLILCSYAGEGAAAWPGQARLAEECGVSERTIRTVLDELVEAGLLSIKRQGLNRPNLYYVHKLPTLPGKEPQQKPTPIRPDPQILPLPDRQNLPVRTGKFCRSRPANFADELESVELDSERDDSNRFAHEKETEDEATADYSPWIAGVITDYSRELGDIANVRSNVTRAVRIWRRSGLPEPQFIDALHQAKLTTRQSQGRQGAGGIARKMPYFFEVLSDQLSPAEPSKPAQARLL